jgi:hypothetical protein
MQASEGFPEAAPDRATLSTLPSDRNVIVAWDRGSSDSRQARALDTAARSALWTAPSEGFNGTGPCANAAA